MSDKRTYANPNAKTGAIGEPRAAIVSVTARVQYVRQDIILHAQVVAASAGSIGAVSRSKED
jgi:hypothetical protein